MSVDEDHFKLKVASHLNCTIKVSVSYRNGNQAIWAHTDKQRGSSFKHTNVTFLLKNSAGGEGGFL